MSSRKTAVAVLALLAAGAPALAGCSQDTSELRQIQPGSSVYIDAWDEDADKGDQAQVERKPSGLWVVPLQAHFRRTKGKGFDVKVELTREGQWRVDPEGAQVGRDHDDCLEDGEAYAQMVPAENTLKFEADKSGGNDGDDCFTANQQS